MKKRMTLLLSLSLTAGVLVGCASAQEKAETAERARLLTEKTYLYSCDELATEAKGYFEANGYELPADRKERNNFLGFSFSGGGSTETKMESSFSFGSGGDDEAKKKPKTKGPPAAVVNTAVKSGVRKRFACWEQEDGAQMEMTTASQGRDGKAQVARDFKDEYDFLKRVDEDGFDEVTAQVRAAGAAAK